MKSFSEVAPVHPAQEFRPFVPVNGPSNGLPTDTSGNLGKFVGVKPTIRPYEELLIAPTIWLWRGNLVIFAPSATDKVQVEELTCHTEKSPVEKAMYYIAAQYQHGNEISHLNWHVEVDRVTMQSIFFYGPQGSDNFWFFPGTGNVTRLFANRGKIADQIVVEAPSVALANDANLTSQETPYSQYGAGDLFAAGAATRAVLFHMQTIELASALRLFQQLAVDAEQLWPTAAKNWSDAPVKVSRADGPHAAKKYSVPKKVHAPARNIRS